MAPVPFVQAMMIVGVTGGIASGKSTVTRMLGDLGAETYSADVDARIVLELGSLTLAAVLGAFPDARAARGGLDRARLATHIFADPAARQTLEAITHPAIIARMRAAITKARESGGNGVLAYETPLLYEAELETLFDAVIATLAAPALQAERLQAREQAAGRPPLSSDAVADRLSAQLSPEEKARRADYVIRTNGLLIETEAQVRAVWDAIIPAPAPKL